jgi:hypothetical protein
MQGYDKGKLRSHLQSWYINSNNVVVMLAKQSALQTKRVYLGVRHDLNKFR